MSQDQRTDLAQAFNSMLINDEADANWYMGTEATSHLAFDSGSLLFISNNSNIKYILVGNGHPIFVTHIGLSKLHTTHRPLHLHNSLVTPNIIKNLISMCRFTSKNKVSIEFDPFVFFVKDLATYQVLLRCDNTGDLYRTTSDLHSSTTLITSSSSLWHQSETTQKIRPKNFDFLL